MNRHVMVDIETLGSKVGSVILSIGAVEFAPGYQEFYRRIELATAVLAGLSIDPNTVKWWTEQDAEARHAAFFCKGGMYISTALEDFTKFVDKDTYLWAKGPDFDCVLLHAAYEKLGMKIPWSYRNTRDVRTITALSGVKENRVGTDHNALDDAKNQAALVIEAYKKLGVQL